jgi:hypothetical protein
MPKQFNSDNTSASLQQFNNLFTPVSECLAAIKITGTAPLTGEKGGKA